MAVLFPVELVIMWALNKYRPAQEYGQLQRANASGGDAQGGEQDVDGHRQNQADDGNKNSGRPMAETEDSTIFLPDYCEEYANILLALMCSFPIMPQPIKQMLSSITISSYKNKLVL